MHATMWARVVLVVEGLAMLAVGWSGFTDPVGLLDPVGVRLVAPNGFSEARAAYGGMHVALGVAFVSGAVVASVRRPLLAIAAAVMLGLAVGRAVSVVVDGVPNAFVLGLAGIETLGAVAAGMAWAADERS